MDEYEYKKVLRKAKQKEIISNIFGLLIMAIVVIAWMWICLS